MPVEKRFNVFMKRSLFVSLLCIKYSVTKDGEVKVKLSMENDLPFSYILSKNPIFVMLDGTNSISTLSTFLSPDSNR